MKILYDTQIFETQKVGGISRYFLELIKQFRHSKNIQVNFPIATSENVYLRKISFLNNVKRPKLSFNKFLLGFKFPGKGRIYRYIYFRNNKKNVIKNLKEGNFEVFHPTYYSPYFLKYIENKPFILNIYDIAHEVYYEDMNKFDRSAKNKKRLLQKASKIIVMSQNTKKDLIKLYNVSEGKIKVIYLANSLKPTDTKPKNIPELPQKYMLFVGGRSGYKNFNLLVKSIAPLLQKDKDMFLICVGQTFSKKEYALFERLKINNKIKYYLTNDSTLSYLYQNAVCFIFPSLYEGFGMPTLESFSCGCPAIISDTSCMLEVGGDAAIYFNPQDSKDILKKVNMVIKSPRIQAQMIKKGYVQLKKFSWKRCAKETENVYREVLTGKL